MLNKKEKIALVISGLELIGATIGGIYCYGQAKFYEGRISKSKELMPVMESMKEELDKYYDQEIKNRDEA